VENVRNYLPLADGFIVGSSLKSGRDVRSPVDHRKVAALKRALGG
jgi:predicted TIM-barrel enzyme